MYVPTPQLEALLAAARRCRTAPEEIVLVLLGEENAPDLRALVAAFNVEGIRFCGGLFPGLLVEGALRREGALVYSWPVQAAPVRVEALSTQERPIPETLRNGWAEASTAFVLVDGNALNISPFLSALQDQLGPSIRYFGGGCGVAEGDTAHCLFDNAGAFGDGALVVLLDLDGAFGVRHGWQRVRGPMVATHTTGNVIQRLNGAPALAVYRRVLEQASGVTLDPEVLPFHMPNYALGVWRPGGEDLIRTPMSAGPDGALICAGTVPDQALLYLLKGQPHALIDSAGAAAEACLSGLDPARSRPVGIGLVAGCLSRLLLLNEEYPRELAALGAPFKLRQLQAPSGMLTIGEIASGPAGQIEYYNKSIVTGIFYEQASRYAHALA